MSPDKTAKEIASCTPQLLPAPLKNFVLSEIPLTEYIFRKSFSVKEICISENSFREEGVRGCGYGK